MKKLFSVLLICAAALCLCACNQTEVNLHTDRPMYEDADPEVVIDEQGEVKPESTESAHQTVEAKPEVVIEETEKQETTINYSDEPVSYHISEVENLDGFDIPFDIAKRKITNDTPNHSGANLRALPDKNSQLIMTIPEGTEVRFLSDVSDNRMYNKIAVTVGDTVYIGYVMERYLTTFTGSAFDCVVASNTPGHKGAKLYDENSASSKVLMTVPEGTELRIINNNDMGDLWCVKIFLNGNTYSGYMLSEYITDKE